MRKFLALMLLLSAVTLTAFTSCSTTETTDDGAMMEETTTDESAVMEEATEGEAMEATEAPAAETTTEAVAQ